MEIHSALAFKSCCSIRRLRTKRVCSARHGSCLAEAELLPNRPEIGVPVQILLREAAWRSLSGGGRMASPKMRLLSCWPCRKGPAGCWKMPTGDVIEKLCLNRPFAWAE